MDFNCQSKKWNEGIDFYKVFTQEKRIQWYSINLKRRFLWFIISFCINQEPFYLFSELEKHIPFKGITK
jgi:hypothetical protein